MTSHHDLPKIMFSQNAHQGVSWWAVDSEGAILCPSHNFSDLVDEMDRKVGVRSDGHLTLGMSQVINDVLVASVY